MNLFHNVVILMVVLDVDVDDILDPFPVAGPAAQGDGVDFVCADFPVEDEVGTLGAVGTVGGGLELFCQKDELLGKAGHVRCVLSVGVEDEATHSVEGFQVALDARELLRLLAGVGADVQEAVLFAALGEQGQEHLLTKNV